jgi:hypothetical protein
MEAEVMETMLTDVRLLSNFRPSDKATTKNNAAEQRTRIGSGTPGLSSNPSFASVTFLL